MGCLLYTQVNLTERNNPCTSSISISLTGGMVGDMLWPYLHAKGRPCVTFVTYLNTKLRRMLSTVSGIRSLTHLKSDFTNLSLSPFINQQTVIKLIKQLAIMHINIRIEHLLRNRASKFSHWLDSVSDQWQFSLVIYRKIHLYLSGSEVELPSMASHHICIRNLGQPLVFILVDWCSDRCRAAAASTSSTRRLNRLFDQGFTATHGGKVQGKMLYTWVCFFFKPLYMALLELKIHTVKTLVLYKCYKCCYHHCYSW